jgi:Tfp pilus assembly protein FimT
MTTGARWGITLVELLIVVTLLGILAGVVLATYEPGLSEQLQGAAQVVVADIAYARSLAVANNSQYSLKFDIAANHYWLEHTGSNALLETLPTSPFRDSSDSTDRQTTDLSSLPAMSGVVELVGVNRVGTNSLEATTSLEFGPLGSLTNPENIVIWLACGGGTARRYVYVEVDPVTGLPEIGQHQLAAPTLGK